MRTFLLIIALVVLSHKNFAQTSDTQSILTLLEQQRKDWNSGDVEAYMQGYWKSDSLLFVGKRGPQYGWNRTLENYRKSYPNKEAMGQLTFNILKVDVYCESNAFVLGEWILDRSKDQLKGFFTLRLKKINNQWLIVADHSS